MGYILAGILLVVLIIVLLKKPDIDEAKLKEEYDKKDQELSLRYEQHKQHTEEMISTEQAAACQRVAEVKAQADADLKETQLYANRVKANFEAMIAAEQAAASSKLETIQKEIDKEVADYRSTADLDRIKLANEIEGLKATLEQQSKSNGEFLTEQLRQIRERLDDKRDQMEKDASEAIDEWIASAQNAASTMCAEDRAAKEATIKELEQNIQELKALFEEFKLKRTAINNAISNELQKEQDMDWYRIQLSPEVKDDIEKLNSLKSSIHDVSMLKKIIYECYIKKNFEDMWKRVLPYSTYTAGKGHPGIYIITLAETGESYIGQALNVSERWQDHVKAACCGNETSKLYRVMREKGIDAFTWDVLEWGDGWSKDELNEREKFYIEEYGTTEVGFNERKG